VVPFSKKIKSVVRTLRTIFNSFDINLIQSGYYNEEELDWQNFREDIDRPHLT
jgi:hypothetical protein